MSLWLEHDDCRIVVEEYWSHPILRCPIFILQKKFELLKLKLKTWNKNVLGDIHHMVNKATSKVDNLNKQIEEKGYSDDLFDQEALAQQEIQKYLHLQECFWKENPRLRWYIQSDPIPLSFTKWLIITLCQKGFLNCGKSWKAKC